MEGDSKTCRVEGHDRCDYISIHILLQFHPCSETENLSALSME